MDSRAYASTAARSNSPWRENHGNLLLVIAAGIILLGGVWTNAQSRSLPRVHRSITARDTEPETNGAPLFTEGTLEEDSPGPDERTRLRIQVFGFSSEQGKARIALFTEPLLFNEPQYADAKASREIVEGYALWEVEVPSGVALAIHAYHDENANGRLDENLLGIPVERYGFSREARAPRGTPPFSEAAFIPEGEEMSIAIEVW